MNFITGINSKTIDMVWEECVPFISRAEKFSQEEMKAEDLYGKIKNQDMQLWVVFNEETEILAVITTELVNYPRKKVCRIVTLGGDFMDDWVEYISVIEDWAIENKCQAMETFCRKGFKKKLENFGYDETYIVLGKELTTMH
jgi:hypothetical protein